MSNSTQLETPGNSSIPVTRPPYYARSFGDPMSRLFWSDGELCIGLLEPQAAYFESVLSSGQFDDLMTDGVICPLQRQTISLDEFRAVYRLERTPRIIYWYEWSAEMLRSASLTLLELLTRLAERGLTLRNPHPWNILFFGDRFSYINPGTVVPLEIQSFARTYDKVARFFVRPLVLMEAGLPHIAYRLMGDVQNGVSSEDFVIAKQDWATWNEVGALNVISAFLRQVQEKLATISLPSQTYRWNSYFERNCDFSSGTSWSRKGEILELLLRDTSIRSVLDIGANSGYYSLQAAGSGREIIATDFDSALTDKIFLEAPKARGTVYPAVMDFSHPSPGQGICGDWFAPASVRLKSDLVLLFAVSHHMVFGKYRLDFEEIAKGVHSFTRSTAIIEHVGSESVRAAEWRPDAAAWYSGDNFVDVLHRFFRTVEILPPAKDGRQLFVCGLDGRSV